MSHTAMRLARAARGILGPKKTVLLLLADSMNEETGACRPSARTLAADGGICERVVRYALDELEAEGLISGEHHPYQATRWTLNLDALADRAAPPPAPHAPLHQAKATPAPDAPPPAPDAPPPAPRADRTRINQKEPLEESPLPPEAGGSAGKPSDFESFWRSYPRPIGRVAAHRAWRRAIRSTEGGAREILYGLRVALDAREFDLRENGRFIPSPAKWLQDGRWTGPPGSTDLGALVASLVPQPAMVGA